MSTQPFPSKYRSICGTCGEWWEKGTFIMRSRSLTHWEHRDCPTSTEEPVMVVTPKEEFEETYFDWSYRASPDYWEPEDGWQIVPPPPLIGPRAVISKGKKEGMARGKKGKKPGRRGSKRVNSRP